MKATMKMKANIGIKESQLKSVSQELNKILADESILYLKTRNYHWNVEGDNFKGMHEFFESQYQQLELIIDEVAERIRKLGHYAEARMKDYLQLTRLDEGEYTNKQKLQLQNLLADHESLIENLRKFIVETLEENNDFGTNDFITGLIEKHEKMAWFIRSYLN